jgi:hypothetical protein
MRREPLLWGVQALLANPAVRRALRVGCIPTLEELASAESPEGAAASRSFDAGVYQGAYYRRFGHWPSIAEQHEERRRIERGERG